MAYYYSLRGWIEVEPENFDSLIKAIKSWQAEYPKDTKIGLYLQGWCWQDSPINWTRYLFYGADVTEEGLKLFEDTLNKLKIMNLNLSGYFHAQGEDKEKNFIYYIDEDNLNRKFGDDLMPVSSLK